MRGSNGPRLCPSSDVLIKASAGVRQGRAPRGEGGLSPVNSVGDAFCPNLFSSKCPYSDIDEKAQLSTDSNMAILCLFYIIVEALTLPFVINMVIRS